MREAVARQGKGWPDRRLAAMAGHGPVEAAKVRRGTWPADLAREFGRLEGGPAHEPTIHRQVPPAGHHFHPERGLGHLDN